MEWKSYGRRRVYDSPYVEVWLDDVDIPGIGRIDHHVITMPKASVTSVVTNEAGDFLLLYRHRFITGRWGWEVPAGWAEPGEDPAAAIAREIEEETGWRPGKVEPLVEYDALAGISTMHFRSFHATGCAQVGVPVDSSEGKVEWLPEVEVVKLLTSGNVADGPSLAALSYYLGPHRLA
ncbi:8-oxo-dGTP pyrophosphatase MutT (NUDIX family) [Kitasatospora gansuensis]|uniref:8-oxo-dGTP pyrophosphatase MutT (NUDIX family) n=1 Tax=Kitasatospora gansuensis TaxID=258050 RepID=A0A7W7SJ60_9ACTN|nr:NUDIX hydrolase [Kitasatospora gansuensis]MBB4951097.1 8-oxo-dGTP pyrophosphatase MutT (NUDIX family) [Kitasatospora gansuensis]